MDKTHKLSKVAAVKFFLQKMEIALMNHCVKFFLFHVISVITLFFIKVCRYFEIFSAAILLFPLKQVF